ncbi:hypothetical protein [Xanthomonas sp. CFBP 8445]|uniref:hypothetical protein n=1 Tax=Xanthomonas sp. CFBP 8445 TaxID=2971236 RepID=UPI0021E0FC48|nr:hypothetical protein [Xanthomonas sp. CFBP 8445]UYC12262.1 hypothetical protein NUG21_00460 [Xanthomonas sp. CFBP 8445]
MGSFTAMDLWTAMPLVLMALVIVVVLVDSIFFRKETADVVKSFADLKDAHAYFYEQDAAGYDCWLRKKKGLWQVRCYLRRPGG